jgi:hypothetical protein
MDAKIAKALGTTTAKVQAALADVMPSGGPGGGQGGPPSGGTGGTPPSGAARSTGTAPSTSDPTSSSAT